MKARGEFVKVRSGPWEQETGKQWGTDIQERLWTCKFLLRGSPSLCKMASSLSVTVKRGRDMSELEGQGEGMRNHPGGQESEGMMDMYCCCQVAATAAVGPVDTSQACVQGAAALRGRLQVQTALFAHSHRR